VLVLLLALVLVLVRGGELELTILSIHAAGWLSNAV
jgi:hypothetical protein